MMNNTSVNSSKNTKTATRSTVRASMPAQNILAVDYDEFPFRRELLRWDGSGFVVDSQNAESWNQWETVGSRSLSRAEAFEFVATAMVGQGISGYEFDEKGFPAMMRMAASL